MLSKLRDDFSWSATFVVLLTVVAILPVLPAIWPAFALGTKLGNVTYLLTVVVLAVGYVVAQTRENRSARIVRLESAANSEKRHGEAMQTRDAQHAELRDAIGHLMKVFQEQAEALNNSPQLKQVGLTAAVSLAKAAATGSLAVLPSALTGKVTADGLVATVKTGDVFKPSGLVAEQKLATVLQNVVAHPPTVITGQLALSKEISALTAQIPNYSPSIVTLASKLTPIVSSIVTLTAAKSVAESPSASVVNIVKPPSTEGDA